MSRAFERRLAELTATYFQDHPPDVGERFVGQFHNPEIASRLTAEFLEVTDNQTTTIEIKGEEQELPAFPVGDDVTIIPVRVRSSDYEDSLEFHEIYQGFATRLRDYTSSGSNEANLSLLFFYEHGVEIDTLESARPTPLYASDGLLPLEQLWDVTLEHDDALSTPANAILGALDDHLNGFGAEQRDIGLLRELCSLRDLLERESHSEVPDAIPKLGTYLRADEFGSQWFDRPDKLESLERVAFEHLESNHDHATRISNSMAVGTTPTRALDGEYEPDFIETVETNPLADINHTAASKHQITVKGNGEKPPKFKSRTVDVTDFQYCDVTETAKGRTVHNGILAVVPDGELQVSAEFSKDVPEKTGTRLRDGDGNEVGEVSIAGAKVTATVDSISPSEELYLSLEVYTGQDNRMGYPECQFDIAVLPAWFYDACINTTLELDYEAQAVVSQPGSTVELRSTKDNKENDSPDHVEVNDEEKHITLTKQTNLEPVYKGADRLRCYVSPNDGGDPVTLHLRPPDPETIITTAGQSSGGTGEPDDDQETDEKQDEIIKRHSDVHLPLHLNAIGDPDIWSSVAAPLMVDPGLGYVSDEEEFQTSSARIEVSSLQHTRLQIEREIRESHSIQPRTVTKDNLADASLSEATSKLPESLVGAYQSLFDYLTSQDRVPSTATWDDDMLGLVETILDTYLDELASIDTGIEDDYKVFRDLGTISIEGTDKQWLTPYHPLMLAYGYKIALWRDGTLLPEELTEGFKEAATYSMFTPIGLLPYRFGRRNDELLTGFIEEGCHLWAKYSGVNTTTADTPPYMETDLAQKLESFTQTFRTLFELHEDRPLKINLYKMGDLEPIIAGLYTFFKRHRRNHDSVPPVVLRIIGPEGQAEQLERFFDEDAESTIRDQLPDNAIRAQLLDRVSYTQTTPQEAKDKQDAHLTFFRDALSPTHSTKEATRLGSSFRMDGLIPQEAHDVFHHNDATISHSGFGDDEHDTQLLAQIARNLNSLEPAVDKQDFTIGNALRQEIRSIGGNVELQQLWEESIWASHVDPPVRLDFYINEPDPESGDADAEGPLLIHYSDQYEQSSPGFDVITITDKRELYTSALTDILEDSGALSHASSEVVLEHLVAIDGSLALDIQQPDSLQTTELLGLIASIAYSKTILDECQEDYAWFPISLREIAQKDYSQRVGSGSGFRFENAGKASDDLCFVGIPREPDSEIEVKLWLVEAKGGTASIHEGESQIKGAYDEFMQKLTPLDAVADGQIRRAELGQIITNIGRRLSHYGVYEEAADLVKQYRDHLRNGDYEPSFLRDEAGRVGEVINASADRGRAEHDKGEFARLTKLPATVIELLSEDSRSLDEILQFMEISTLEFGDEGPAPDYQETTDADEDDEDGTDDDNERAEQPTGEGEAADTEGEDVSTPPTEAESEADDEDSEEGESEATAKDSTESSTATTGDDEATDDGSDSREPPTDQDLESVSYEWESGQLSDALSFLTESPDYDVEVDVDRLTAELRSQFDSLGVDIHPPDPSTVTVGPRKIGINIRPESGQRINSILNNLESLGVHIQAKGKITGQVNSAAGAVRLEIPHGQQQPIHLRSGLEALAGEEISPLTVPLGIDTENQHHTLDLLEERHLLVGGTTGSGKSNFLTGVVSSLGLAFSPRELSLSLLDPKGIDFQSFAALPHVGEEQYIDTGRASVDYLMDLVDSEIPRRRELLQNSPARTIQEYNGLPDREPDEQIPYHVVMIDEFADLILGLEEDRQEFIDAVQRLTQTGRAFGISLVLATQRPSADVVPGEIKANLPARLSFELPSNTDSRVILDQPGAEDLEGAGDMIVKPRTGGELHLQSYYVPPVDLATITELLSMNS